MKGRKTLGRIAWRLIVSNKKRSAVFLSAIILTSMMLSSVLSLGVSYLDTIRLHGYRVTGHNAHLTFENPTPEQMDVVSEFPHAIEYSNRLDIGELIIEQTDFFVTMATGNDILFNFFLRPAWSGFRGRVPRALNELIAPVELLNQMGFDNPRIGMTVPLTFTAGGEVQEKDFILTALYNDFSWAFGQRERFVYVSEEFASQFHVTRNVAFLYFEVAGPDDVWMNRFMLNYDAELTEAQQLSTVVQYGISPQAVMAIITVIAIVILFLAITSVLLIGNTMYILVQRDVRMYGLFKAIGSSKKHVAGLFRRYTLLTSIIGAPVGVVLGSLIAFLFVPLVVAEGFFAPVVTFSPIVFAISMVIAVAVTYISAFIPSIKTWRRSIIETARFMNIKTKKKAKSSASGKPHLLAIRNVFRDKRKAAYTLISLSIGVAVFVVIATIVNSFDLEHNPDLQLIYDFEIVAMPTVNTPLLRRNFVDQVANFPGVNEVHTFSSHWALFDVNEIFEDYFQVFISRYEERTGSPAARYTDEAVDHSIQPGEIFIVQGSFFDVFEFDYFYYPWILAEFESFDRGEIAYVITNWDTGLFDNIEEIHGFLSLDDEGEPGFPFSIPFGGVLPFFDFLGYMNPQDVDRSIPLIMISPAFMDNLFQFYGIEASMGYTEIFLTTNQDYDMQIMGFLESLMQGSDIPPLAISSRMEARQTLSTMRTILVVLGGGMAVMIGLTALVNFVNSIVSGVVERKREFAIFESIGMSKTKIRAMLLAEGLYYAVFPALIGITAGSVAVYFLVSGLTFSPAAGVLYQSFFFAYPFVFVISMIILVILFCLAASSFAFSTVKSTTIVDKLKESDWV